MKLGKEKDQTRTSKRLHAAAKRPTEHQGWSVDGGQMPNGNRGEGGCDYDAVRRSTRSLCIANLRRYVPRHLTVSSVSTTKP